MWERMKPRGRDARRKECMVAAAEKFHAQVSDAAAPLVPAMQTCLDGGGEGTEGGKDGGCVSDGATAMDQAEDGGSAGDGAEP
ncbi:MAG: hypothetical protein CMJ86_05775 [Planctomycetes bacterium]|nr:hypothetical protein [Planctomycetota bacterium]